MFLSGAWAYLCHSLSACILAWYQCNSRNQCAGKLGYSFHSHSWFFEAPQVLFFHHAWPVCCTCVKCFVVGNTHKVHRGTNWTHFEGSLGRSWHRSRTALETTGVPVTGGPPMLMSKAVYYSWRSIYMSNKALGEGHGASKFIDSRTSSDWNSRTVVWQIIAMLLE